MSKKTKPSLLIVDDDSDTLYSLRLIFEKEGFKVFIAENSENAVMMLSNKKIDIVLLDYKLGSEDGIAIGEKLIEISKKIKIILLTAYPSYELAVESTKRGFHYFFDKGTATNILVKKVKETVAEEKLPSNNKKIQVNKEDCLRFITFCRHSLIVEQIKNLSKENICLDYSKNFHSINEVVISKFQKEVDIALLCATCIFKGWEETFMALKELFNLFPFVKIIIINDKFSDDEKAQLLKMGVKGFFSSEMTSTQIKEALMTIHNGGIWAKRKVLNIAIQPNISHISRVLAKFDNTYNLSNREKEILKTMVLGLRNKDIADRLYISEKTVKTHINRIFKKLSVDSRVKAILKAKEENLV